MSNKAIASWKSFGKFLGFSLATLTSIEIAKHGLWAVDWLSLAKDSLAFVVTAVLKGLMTWWKTEG